MDPTDLDVLKQHPLKVAGWTIGFAWPTLLAAGPLVGGMLIATVVALGALWFLWHRMRDLTRIVSGEGGLTAKVDGLVETVDRLDTQLGKPEGTTCA